MHTKKDVFGVICFVLATIVIVVVLILCLSPKEYNIRVKDKYWEFHVNFETLETYYEDGWSVPFGATVYEIVEEVYDYEEILLGYDIDGYPIYQYEPIYEPYYYYTIDRWTVTRTEVTSGSFEEQPYYASTGCFTGERLGSMYEYYKVGGTVNRDYKEFNCPIELWTTLELTKPYKIVVQLGTIQSAELLPR